MAAYAVCVWADDLIPVALYATKADAELFREKLLSHYGTGTPPWEQAEPTDKHHPSVQNVLDKTDLFAANVYKVVVFEFDCFGGFRGEVPRAAAAHPKDGD